MAEYPKDCCGGKCLLRCYPIAKVMLCPHPTTPEDIEAAKRAFMAREAMDAFDGDNGEK